MFNDNITLYHFVDNTNYKRIPINGVFWDETKKSNTLKSGMSNSDSITIVIPTDKNIDIEEGKDLVVKGICTFKGNTNIKKVLCEEHDAKTVSIIDRKLYGGLPHIELSCK